MTTGARAAAETAFRHLVGALTAGPATAFAGQGAGPHCELLPILTQNPNEFVAGYGQTLLRTILEHRSSLTESQFLAAGVAARNLLAFAWVQQRRNSWLVKEGLRSVCATFSSNVAASAALLRRSIATDHLSAYGFEEMPIVARETDAIAIRDPDLLLDIYAAVFSHDEPSKESTDLSGSRILPITSNRRQDYQLAMWQLGQSYPRFAQRAPVAATRAMARGHALVPPRRQCIERFASAYQLAARAVSAASPRYANHELSGLLGDFLRGISLFCPAPNGLARSR